MLNPSAIAKTFIFPRPLSLPNQFVTRAIFAVADDHGPPSNRPRLVAKCYGDFTGTTPLVYRPAFGQPREVDQPKLARARMNFNGDVLIN
jgi:hypothetical protein